MAHSNESKVCSSPPGSVTVNALSYSLPQTSHFPMTCPLQFTKWEWGDTGMRANRAPRQPVMWRRRRSEWPELRPLARALPTADLSRCPALRAVHDDLRVEHLQ